MNEYDVLIGMRIKELRESLDMSQEELATKIGYKSKTSINKIELGVQGLTQSKIKAIADALGTTPDFIMGWEIDADDYAVTQEETDFIVDLKKKYGSIDNVKRMLAYLDKLLELKQ